MGCHVSRLWPAGDPVLRTVRGSQGDLVEAPKEQRGRPANRNPEKHIVSVHQRSPAGAPIYPIGLHHSRIDLRQ